MAGMQYELMVDQLNKLNDKVHYACNQVKLINQEMELLNVRYSKALQNEKPAFRYSLRLRLATYEGVRETILLYARMLANKMDQVEEEIYNIGNV